MRPCLRTKMGERRFLKMGLFTTRIAAACRGLKHARLFAMFSGAGKAAIPADFQWAESSSSLAIASGVLRSHPEARTIVQIGGQTSLVIELEDGLEKPWKVASNALCAAGTGRFLEQQSYRLGIRIEDFGGLAMSFKGNAPRIAARCSVFAKSDLIHLQQKGVSVESMLYALC